MAVTAEKPGSFPRGHSLHLGSHPQEAGSGSFIGDGVQKEQEQKLQGLWRLQLKSQSVTLLRSTGQSKPQWQRDSG